MRNDDRSASHAHEQPRKHLHIDAVPELGAFGKQRVAGRCASNRAAPTLGTRRRPCRPSQRKIQPTDPNALRICVCWDHQPVTTSGAVSNDAVCIEIQHAQQESSLQRPKFETSKLDYLPKVRRLKRDKRWILLV